MMEIDIRELRKKLGWSQETLAQNLGVSPATVSRWERGTQRPSPSAYSQLNELWLKAGSRGKSAFRVKLPASQDETSTTSVQQIGDKRYKTTVFRLGRDPGATYQEWPGTVPEAPGRVQSPSARDFDGAYVVPTESREKMTWAGTPRPCLPLNSARRDEFVLQSRDVGRPKSRRRLNGILMKLGIPAAIFFLLAVGTVSTARANGIELSADLPQALAKVFPHLETFIYSVEDDLIAIGTAYVKQDTKAAPDQVPEQSLDAMLQSVSELNEQLGVQADDNGLFAKVSDVFRQKRNEAWSRVSQSAAKAQNTPQPQTPASKVVPQAKQTLK